LNSVPASIRIFVDDRNDNGPKIRISRREIEISNGKFVRPFAVKIEDADIAPFNLNDVLTDGNASRFISLERIRNDLYIARLSSLPNAGIYELEVVARDVDGVNPPSIATVTVNVLDTMTKAYFKRSRYERTINHEKLHKGNPLLHPEFDGARIGDVRFIILRDDPGWLLMDEYSGNVFVGDVPKDGVSSGKYDISIAAVNRTSGQVLSETIFSLTVVNGGKVTTVFKQKLLSKVFRKDPSVAHFSLQVLSRDDKSAIKIIRESISAVDEKLHKVSVDRSAISLVNGNVLFQMNKLQNIRSIQFQLVTDENADDKGTTSYLDHISLVMVYLSSDPEQVAARNRELSRPKFINPWKTDLNIIPIKLAEETPEGYIVLSLPAYNPLNGERYKDLRLSGDMSQYFTVDPETGECCILCLCLHKSLLPASEYDD
uniref:Cadherin domain protein n=1 Tax=Anisakis simplex TaxID=6269 RepID=A0A0M3J200_ANISI